MQFLRFSVLVLCTLVFTTCKNDLKLNAPYEEIPSVYAVFNPEDTIHILRINKSFLGETDANLMAQVADSINYGPGEIEVTLRRFVNGVRSTVMPASSDTVLTFHDSTITTKPGSFNTNQRVYVANRKPGTKGKLYTDGQYILKIKNLHTGNLFTARANSLRAVIPYYQPMLPPYYPYKPGEDPKYFIDYSIGSAVFEVKHPPNEAQIYQLFLRMHYVDSISFQQAYNYSIEMLIGSRTVREVIKLGGLSYLSHTFSGNVIYSGLAGELSKHKYNLIGRRMFAIEYIVYNSTQEYQDYMEYVKPSLSISQTKPLYSNFDGKKALGIFTFRNRVSVMKEISNTYKTSMARNPTTCSYKIFDAKLTIPGCK